MNRWKQVFRHEFISLIWLREKGYNLTSASSNKETYIPKRAFQSGHCYCGLQVAETCCEYCNSPCRTQITKRVHKSMLAMERMVQNNEMGPLKLLAEAAVECDPALQPNP